MWVPFGQPFTATLITPPGLEDLALGARIEVPVTRAIVGNWRAAVLDGYVWSVELEAPPKVPLGQGQADPAFLAALAAGAFQIVWMDPAPEVEVFVPLWCYSGSGIPGGGDAWPPVDRDAVRPDVEDVAALSRTRTYQDFGEGTTFDADTRPSADEVDGLIDKAVSAVLARLRPAFPEELYEDTTYVIALYTAVLIEGSYFREQQTGNTGNLALYRDLFNQQIEALTTAIENAFTDAYAPLRLA